MAKTGNRVYQYTSSSGTGEVILDGSAVFPSFFTADEAGFAANDTAIALLEEGDDVEISNITISQLSPFTFSRDSVIASRISGVAGTTAMNLSGGATVQFIIEGADYDNKPSFDYATPTAALEAAGDLTLNSDNGQVLVFEHTLAGNAEVQIPTNMKDGSTIYLIVDPGAFTLSWATGTGFYAGGGVIDSVTDRTWYAITRLGSQYHVAVVAQSVGAL